LSFGYAFAPTRVASIPGATIERIGAKLEGILRSHRMAADYTPRDSARFSIVAEEWPVVKQQLRNHRRSAGRHEQRWQRGSGRNGGCRA
jgi:hypothetical protein